ncbi:LOG family protein [Stieleria sp. JC731]|uniref:LOG family protein n=1 Tax=Pirellulaceae TaxID=2691357 RepID=UPI001E48BA6A|nr:LOG family protein [Stieleria sp. JC731]MCC9600212.1 LOG family protein [Stieleria sp. JC731]
MDAKDFDPQQLPPEAIGESEPERPQPADDPIVDSAPPEKTSLFDEMRATIDRLERDQTSRGDLKVLSRTLLELRYAFKVFRPYRRRRKVTIFGSARTKPDHPDYQSAVQLGRQMAGHGWMVITGAGGGIMEAGHVGAGKEASMGLNIMLPFEQGANHVIEGDPKLVTMKYFFTRKLMFVKECSAVVCCPGGFGTLDEALETLTLMQTGKQTMLPLVLLDHPNGHYWSDFGKFVDRNLGEGGMISGDDTALYKITNDVGVAVKEILQFYRRYHSMRYVHDRLVFRLKERLSDEKLDSLNENFADILVKGKITQSKSLPEEAGEPDLAGLPRLVLHFNRRSLGRLRLLINEINAD